jgi:hypothetical protein
MNSLSRLARVARVATLVTLVLAVPLVAEAAVRKEGTWPASDKTVSFEFDGKPSDGLNKLADEAGWSLVVSKAIATDEHDVKIAVEDQPADAVLEALFAESNVVARRSGSLVTITPDHGAPAPAVPPLPVAPPVPPVPPAGADAPSTVTPPPVPTSRGEDRNVFGSSLVVGEHEIVHTVTVTGGSARIYGTVTGDLIVAGGSARIEKGARVVGNATVFGGSLRVESGARVDGDVGIVGGALKREEGAIIGGKIVKDGHGNVGVTVGDSGASTEVHEGKKRSSGRGRLSEAVSSLGRSVTNMSLLFVFGCVLLALGARRMERLRIEAAARPMRSFAMGIVGGFCMVLALTAMCITVVGIPFALLAALIGVFGVYASVAAVLTTFGAAVAGHRSQNPYVHLFIGCAALLVVGLIPFVGGLVTFVVVMIAVGSLVSTRFAGVVQKPAKSAMV